MNKIILIVVFVSMWAVKTYSLEYLDALEKYENEDYEDAYKRFSSLAAIGNASAQYHIGLMNLNGEHVRKNIVDAYAWVTIASFDGPLEYLETQKEIFTKLKPEEKLLANNKFLSLNEKFGQGATYKKYFYGETDKNNEAYSPPRYISSSHIEGAVEVKSIRSANAAALIYFDIDEYGITRNHDVVYSSNKVRKNDAIHLFRAARYKPATMGGKPIRTLRHSVAIGFSYDNTHSIGESKDNTALLKRSFYEVNVTNSVNSVNAELTNTLSLKTGVSQGGFSRVAQSPENWLISAARFGYPFAQSQVALHHMVGDISGQDSEKALFWLNRSASKGDLNALYVLGVALIEGDLLTQNIPQGLKFLSEAAEKSEIAKMEIARYYATNKDSRIYNPQLAKHYIEKVKERSYPDKMSFYEISAAVYAASNEFSRAIRMQKRAIKKGKRYQQPIGHMKTVLREYIEAKSVQNNFYK